MPAPVLVDSNVLIDLATSDPVWARWSSTAIAAAADESILVINPLIYAEVSIAYRRIEDMDAAFPPTLFRRDDLPYGAAFLAGKAFLAYRRRGGPRTAPLPDFFIGAHAALVGYRILTRDPSRYRTSFPAVEIIAPA